MHANRPKPKKAKSCVFIRRNSSDKVCHHLQLRSDLLARLLLSQRLGVQLVEMLPIHLRRRRTLHLQPMRYESAPYFHLNPLVHS